jgi:hypothetical protein
LLARSQVCTPDITGQRDGAAHDFDSRDRGFHGTGATNAAKAILLRNYPVLSGTAESDGGCWRVQLVQHARGNSSDVRDFKCEPSRYQTQKPGGQDIESRELVDIDCRPILEQELEPTAGRLEAIPVDERDAGFDRVDFAVAFEGCRAINKGDVCWRCRRRWLWLLSMAQQRAGTEDPKKDEQRGARHDVPQGA